REGSGSPFSSTFILRCWFQSCIVKPTNSCPCSFRIAAAAEESTPPLIATAIFIAQNLYFLRLKVQLQSEMSCFPQLRITMAKSFQLRFCVKLRRRACRVVLEFFHREDKRLWPESHCRKTIEV